MFIIWQKGNKFLGWLYVVIAILASLGLLQRLFSNSTTKDDVYLLIGILLFAFFSWYCFQPAPKGRWVKLDDGRKAWIEEKKPLEK